MKPIHPGHIFDWIWIHPQISRPDVDTNFESWYQYDPPEIEFHLENSTWKSVSSAQNVYFDHIH